MQRFDNARDAALALRPDDPVYCFRPEVLKADARHFLTLFPGKTAYAVKTNGEPLFGRTIGLGTKGLPGTAPKLARELRTTIAAHRAQGGEAGGDGALLADEDDFEIVRVALSEDARRREDGGPEVESIGSEADRDARHAL